MSTTTTNINPQSPVADARGSFLPLLAAGAIAGWQLYSLHRQWRQHLAPIDAYTTTGDALFLETHVTREHCSKRGGHVWKGVLRHDASMRGMQTDGMSFGSFLWAWAVIGRQYTATIARNVVAHALNKYHAPAITPSSLYGLVMNTSLATGLDDAGDVVFFDLKMPRCRRWGLLSEPHGDGADEHYVTLESFRVHLDHEAETVSHVSADGVVIDDPAEMAAALHLVTATHVHPHIHWWANGVKDAERVWPAAAVSATMTQYLNYLSVRGSVDIMGLPADQISSAIAHSLTNSGLPVHSRQTKPYTSRSTFHRLIAASRTALVAHLGYDQMLLIESILAATVMHSADHYYLAVYGGAPDACPKLGVDALFVQLAVTQPVPLRGGLLCRERRDDDPICALLHSACRSVDPVFADTALYVGIAA